MQITDFLRKRFDEAEAAARATTERQPYDVWDAVGDERDGDIAQSNWAVVAIASCKVAGPAARAVATHIALNDPAYVLADIAAKREILATHTIQHSMTSEYTDCTACMDVDAYDSYPCRTIRLMARPFADHPNYQAEWMP